VGYISAASPTDALHGDNWHGGYYELSIKLGDHDDGRLDVALNSLWEAAGLSRPFRHREAERGREETRVSGASLLAGHLDAIATIPGLGATLCTVIVVREESFESGVSQYGADWLDLCLPLGALGNLDQRVGAYPFDDTAPSRSWREPIERWFAAIGQAVFRSVPFLHAVTGFEVSGVEPSEVNSGWVGLFRPTHQGALAIDPVSNW